MNGQRRLADAWRDCRLLTLPEHGRFTAARTLELWLTEALWPFHPSVRIDNADEPSGRTPPAWGAVPLYNRCCLELYNHMAEGLVWRRCANEACEAPFVRQAGRAVLGQHRTRGVRFHTAKCARAQTERERRRRQKEKEQ